MKELKFGTYWQSKKSEGEFWTFDGEECTWKDEDHDWTFDDEECLYVEGSTNHEDNYYVKEPIEWLVLDEDDEKALLLSKYALDAKAYNEERKGITWENCSLRKWLNSEFLGKAFCEEEKARIIETTVKADINPNLNDTTGKDTLDLIFLLNAKDFERYLRDKENGCKGTAYCCDNGAYYNDENGYCQWWLRSDCFGPDDAAAACSNDYYYGHGVNFSEYGVRPALWIKK